MRKSEAGLELKDFLTAVDECKINTSPHPHVLGVITIVLNLCSIIVIMSESLPSCSQFTTSKNV